jgi:hypothetical protein
MTPALAFAWLALAAVQPPADTVRATRVATIGELAPRTPFLIGEVSGLALDDAGRVYVSDFQDPRVLVFGGDGRHLATIGRKGRGPGEFEAPTGPVVGPDGALYVRNMERVMRFVPPGAGRIPARFDRQFPGPVMAPWRSKLPSVIDRERRFHFPVEAGLQDGLTHYAFWRYGLDGRRLDSLPVPTWPTTRSNWASYRSRIVPGLHVVPFHPVPAWAVTPAGTVLGGPADRYELSETDAAGRELRRFGRTVTPARIPGPERAESARALRRRVDSLGVPIAEVRGASEEVRAGRLPDVYPAYRGVVATPAGEVWVRRWPPPTLRGASLFDVFGATGAYRHTLVLPADCAGEPAPAVRGRLVACVEVDAETGAESVVVARLP